jgi:DNA-binding response OmpR family regulator
MNDFLYIGKVAAWEDRVETILLVEDEAFVRNVTREILQAAGYRVLTAGDGVAARRLYDEFAPEVDLLLTDMILPGGNGGELAARIRRQDPELRVLFVTGYADQIVVLKDAGDEYLLKPFCSEVLLRKVAELMDEPGAQGEQAQAAQVQVDQVESVMRACVGA